MPLDLFIPRSAADAPHPSYPLPGAAPGSIALEEGDGATQTYTIGEFEVIAYDGHSRNRVAWGDDLKATLLVTDTRIVFASTRMLKSYRGTKHLTVMGQIRYESLAGVAGANYNALRGAIYLRLVAPSPSSPDEADLLNIITLKPMGPIYGGRWGGADLAGEIVRRATLRREVVSEGSATQFEETKLAKGGTAWIGLTQGDRWHAATIESIGKGLGLLG